MKIVVFISKSKSFNQIPLCLTYSFVSSASANAIKKNEGFLGDEWELLKTNMNI